MGVGRRASMLAAFSFFFFFCLVVFVCSYLPHSLLCLPLTAAWGMIKSVYACPQSEEIGVNTHPYSHFNGQTQYAATQANIKMFK